MKNKWIRFLCLTLGLLCCLSAFAACSGGKTPEDTEAESGTKEEVSSDEKSLYDENGYEYDSIDRDLSGKTLHILMDASSEGDVWPSASTNGVNDLYDKSFVRKEALLERLDCSVKITTAPGESTGVTKYLSVAEQADTYNFDLMCAFSLTPAVIAQRGLLVNVLNLEYPELEKPWWPDMLDDWKYDGSLYFLANNSSFRVIYAMETVLANRQMIEDNGLASLEEVVIDGGWTLEVMQEYTATVSDSVDGTYGLVVDDFSRMDMFLYGGANYLTGKGDDGKVRLSLFDQSSKEKVTTLISTMSNIFGTTGTILSNGGDLSVLKTAQAMFYGCGSLYTFVSQCGNDTSYMALPAPKTDSSQDRYYVVPNNSYDTWCIPKSAQNAEDSGLFLEALASSDYRDFAPYLFENKLKLHYSSNENGSKIFDIIRQSVYVDFGRIYAQSLTVMETSFRDCFWSEGAFRIKDVYISRLDGRQGKIEGAFATLVAALNKYSK